jgi:hypothetical protein
MTVEKRKNKVLKREDASFNCDACRKHVGYYANLEICFWKKLKESGVGGGRRKAQHMVRQQVFCFEPVTSTAMSS